MDCNRVPAVLTLRQIHNCLSRASRQRDIPLKFTAENLYTLLQLLIGIYCKVRPYLTSVLRDSSLKKSKRAMEERGSHVERTTQATSPWGSPGSLMFFLVVTLISSPPFETFCQVLYRDAPMLWQKLKDIRWASFRMLFLPANVETPKGKQSVSRQ